MVKKRIPAAELPSAQFLEELGKPIELPVPRGWELSAEQWTEHRQTLLREERMRKLPMLFQHFELEYGDWPGLALELAYSQVPGLTWKDKLRAGAPRFWNLARYNELKNDMEKVFAKDPSCNVADAARSLAGTKKWQTLLKGRKNPAEVLRTRYFEMIRQ